MAKKLNLFATSSSEGFLKCLVAPPGHVVIGSDINSLEPHVLAHFSQDPGYLKIYHKDASPNCIYLYRGAHSSQHGHLFRSVYDPNNSTLESVERAKALYSSERQLYKVEVLTLQYEGTEYALDRQYKKANIEVPWDRLRQQVSEFKTTFAGLPEFRRRLQAQWRANGGYILTGRSRPLAVSRDKVDDIIADFCQSTGHDYVMRWIYHKMRFRDKHKLKCRPFIPDLHDAGYHVCLDHPDEIAGAKEMFKYGYDTLNAELGLDVKFKGDLKIGKTLYLKGK